MKKKARDIFPEARRDEQKFGDVTVKSTAIGHNRLMTPGREKIGTSTMPVPGEGGSAEFMHDMHHAAGSTRRGK